MSALPSKYFPTGRDVGEETKYCHTECNDTRFRLYVQRIASGYLYYCHNCGVKGIHRLKSLAPEDTKQLLLELKDTPALQEHGTDTLKLPKSFEPTITTQGCKWLMKYGIRKDEAVKYKFGTVVDSNRLMLPVYDGDNLVYYQARNLGVVDKYNPKYLNIKAKEAKDIVWSSEGQYELPHMVLVEDILSGIKVGRYIQTKALMGSYIPDSLIKKLQGYKKIGLWLDPDKARESLKYANKLTQILGVPVIPILEDKDPKEFSDDAVYEIIKRTFIHETT